MSRTFKMTFGKYKGETLEEIYVNDVDYLQWILDQKKIQNPRDGLIREIEQCFKEMRKVRICE